MGRSRQIFGDRPAVGELHHRISTRRIGRRVSAQRLGGQDFLYHQLLAQHGIAVWVCDNRLASGKGAQSQWPSYKNFGELEMRDIEDGLAYLKKRSWVDRARIGIDGWSFGGFMVTYALTHSTSFAMGIGGTSPTVASTTASTLSASG